MVGENFSADADEGDGEGDGLEESPGCGVAGDEEVGKGEDEDGEGLGLEEPEEGGVDAPLPDLAEFLVAGVFGRVVLADALLEMVAEANAPEGGECTGCDTFRFIAISEESKEDAGEGDPESPEGIDQGVVGDFFTNEPADKEEGVDEESDAEEDAPIVHAVVSFRCLIRRARRLRSGIEIALMRMRRTGARINQATIPCRAATPKF